MRETTAGVVSRSAIRVVAADWPVLRGLVPGPERLEAAVEDDEVVAVDLALLLVGPDDRPLQGLAGFMDWKANGSLAALLSRGSFVGRRGEKLLRPAEPELPFARIVLFGVGQPGDWAEGEGTAVAHELINCVRQMRASSVALGWVAEGSPDEPWDAVFDALVSALSKGEVAAPGPPVAASSAGLEQVHLEAISAAEPDPAAAEAEAKDEAEAPAEDPPGSNEPQASGEEAAPSHLPEASEGEGEDAPRHETGGAEARSASEQWWIVAPEALCTRLRGRVLGTPRPAGSL